MSASASDSRVYLVLAGALAALSACSSSDKASPGSGGVAATSGSGGAAGSSADTGGTAGSSAGTSDGTAGASPNGGSAGQVSTEPSTDYAADDPNILYSGRIDFSNAKSPEFASPAITIRANFHGDSLAIKVRDSHESGNPNYFDVIVDDQPAVKIMPTLVLTSYPVPIQLADADHTVTVTKRTEASVGFANFQGFTFGGHILPPPAAPTHKMEIIGDSITAGAGMEAVNGSAQCNDTYGEAYQNGYLSYGAVAARALNAEYHVTGVSGIGLVQNYSQSYDARPMPQVYDLLNVEQNGPLGDPSHTADQLGSAKISPLWDTTKFVPDAVVIGLGTNDFSPGDGVAPSKPAIPARMKLAPADYAVAYEAFITQLRTYYPDADYFCLSSPILGDGYPTAADTYATDLKTALADMAAYYAGKSDMKVHTVIIDKVAGNGCGGHPDVAQQAAAAAQVQAAISAALGW
jgi:hypothetical protein